MEYDQIFQSNKLVDLFRTSSLTESQIEEIC